MAHGSQDLGPFSFACVCTVGKIQVSLSQQPSHTVIVTGPKNFGPHHNDDMMTALFFPTVSKACTLGKANLGGRFCFECGLARRPLKTPNVATHRPNAAIRHTVAGQAWLYALSCRFRTLLEALGFVPSLRRNFFTALLGLCVSSSRRGRTNRFYFTCRQKGRVKSGRQCETFGYDPIRWSPAGD